MPSLRLFKASYSSLISYNKFIIILLIIGCSNTTPPSTLKASDSEFDSSELVESSVTLGYKVLDLLLTITLYYRTFWLTIITILIDFNSC